MAPNRIKIGTMIVARPHSRMLNMAMSLATDLGPLFADMTLGLPQKYHALVIHRKTKYALKHHIKENESYNLTAGILDILMAKPDDYANTERTNILAESVEQNVIQRLKKRDQKTNLSRQALANTDSKIQTSATTATSLVEE